MLEDHYIHNTINDVSCDLSAGTMNIALAHNTSNEKEQSEKDEFVRWLEEKLKSGVEVVLVTAGDKHMPGCLVEVESQGAQLKDRSAFL